MNHLEFVAMRKANRGLVRLILQRSRFRGARFSRTTLGHALIKAAQAKLLSVRS